jgi:hypothetical protein
MDPEKSVTREGEREGEGGRECRTGVERVIGEEEGRKCEKMIFIPPISFIWRLDMRDQSSGDVT